MVNIANQPFHVEKNQPSRMRSMLHKKVSMLKNIFNYFRLDSVYQKAWDIFCKEFSIIQ